MNIATMTPAEKNAEIAKRCGWTKEPDADMWKNSHGVRLGAHHLPNYVGDLNAMRDAVAALGEQQRHDYAVILAMSKWPLGWTDWTDTLAVSEAAAAQRAEAFLEATSDP